MTTIDLDPLARFIREQSDAPGALDALEALHAATSALSEDAARRAYSAGLHAAQRDARDAVKDKRISVRGGSYNVAETEQLIGIAREVLADNGLSVAVGGSHVVEKGGSPFLCVRYGVRHVEGFVEWSEHEWPLTLSGGQMVAQNNRRATSTTALGYFLRDLLLLRRRDDESEQHAAHASRQSPRSGPAGRPSPPPTSGSSARFAALLGRIREIENPDELDAAGAYVADLVAAHVNGDATFRRVELDELRDAVIERREELGQAATE